MQLPPAAYGKLFKALAPICKERSARSEGKGGASAFPMASSRWRHVDPRSHTPHSPHLQVASAFPMAPPPDDDAGAADATSLVEMSDEAVKEAISKIKAAFLRFFVSMMADYQKVMIAPSPHTVA